ncbi:hypothetical protein BDA96_04G356000 [Sorghum bicolor]|uniref:Uncharacterized protein n=1 Tax=Sorghum bicolor TaxID=4558 RepID=A0A921UMY7_SORBI|nr:hypothetical protein BDA96_04G356000 [Sorghum bicolor]
MLSRQCTLDPCERALRQWWRALDLCARCALRQSRRILVHDAPQRWRHTLKGLARMASPGGGGCSTPSIHVQDHMSDEVRTSPFASAASSILTMGAVFSQSHAASKASSPATTTVTERRVRWRVLGMPWEVACRPAVLRIQQQPI